MSSNELLFKIVRKEKLINKSYLLTIEFVFTKNMFNRINETLRNLEVNSYVYLTTNYNLKLGQIYQSSFDKLEKLNLEKDSDEFDANFLPEDNIYLLVSRPKKYYKIDELLRFSDVYNDFDIELLKENYPYEDYELDVKVYNVKQGNMNTIHSRNGVILYDWGTDKPVLLKGFPIDLNLFDITTIILSHHHFDHYSIFVKKNFPKLKFVIIPDGVMSGSLSSFIKRHSGVKVVVVPLSSPRNVSYFGTFSNLHFYIGPKSSTSSNKNNEGIIVNVSSNKNIKSLTGDVYWYLYLQSLRLISCDKIISFVVPHHGGNIGKTSKLVPFNFEKCIYSYGIPNRHGHPNPYTESMMYKYTKKRLDTCKINVYEYHKL